jgi:hypothetical protein
LKNAAVGSRTSYAKWTEEDFFIWVGEI